MTNLIQSREGWCRKDSNSLGHCKEPNDKYKIKLTLNHPICIRDIMDQSQKSIYKNVHDIHIKHMPVIDVSNQLM